MVHLEAYGGDALLNDLQTLFTSQGHPADSKVEVARVCDAWKARQLEAQGLSVGSDTAVLLQKLSRSVQSVVHRHPGRLDGESFMVLRPQIEDAWQRLLRNAPVASTFTPLQVHQQNVVEVRPARE